jgi:hypothetical protein
MSMTYAPQPMPFEHMMFFDRWVIWSNYLNLYFTYVYSSQPTYNSPLYRSSQSSYRFYAYAPDITSPLDFTSGAWTRLGSAFFLPSNQSLPGVARIMFDPQDPVVTWGGPFITLRITVPNIYAEFEVGVQLPAYTDPATLDGRIGPA